MRRGLELIIAVVCCAISFPVIGLKNNPERKEHGWLPIPPDQAKLDAEKGSWFHRKKDLLVNSVRADPEWWGKFFSWVCVSLSSAVMVLGAVVFVQLAT